MNEFNIICLLCEVSTHGVTLTAIVMHRKLRKPVIVLHSLLSRNWNVIVICDIYILQFLFDYITNNSIRVCNLLYSHDTPNTGLISKTTMAEFENEYEKRVSIIPVRRGGP